MVCSEPSGFMTKTSQLWLGRRVEYRIRAPSGDQAGCVSPAAPPVKRVNPEPSTFITKTWVGPSRFEAKTIRLPSGDREGYASALGWLVRLVTEPSALCTKMSRFPSVPESEKTIGLAGVAVAVGVGVRVWVAVWVGVGVAEGVAVAVSVGPGVSVGVAVCVAVSVGVAVGVGVAVDAGVEVAVGVGGSGVLLPSVAKGLTRGVGASVDVAEAVTAGVAVGSAATGVPVGAARQAASHKRPKHTMTVPLDIRCFICFHISSFCNSQAVFWIVAPLLIHCTC